MAKTTKVTTPVDGADIPAKNAKTPKVKAVKTVEVSPVVSVSNDTPIESLEGVVIDTPIEKAKKSRSIKKVKEVVPELEVSLDAVSGEKPVENVVIEQENDEIVALSNEFCNKLNQVASALSSLRADYKVLERKYMKELKASQKLNNRKKRKANRAPSGFVKPTKISNELATFLGKPLGFEMARTEVTREINKYIRLHNLQDSVNGRKINPNPALATLLKIKPTDELTYFNLQRYMSSHFQKLVPVVVETVSASL
jgi:chromatin remodeling complex protein RSC6